MVDSSPTCEALVIRPFLTLGGWFDLKCVFIILGCDSPTERIPAFVDKLLQSIAQSQKSNIKDTTNFISLLRETVPTKHIASNNGCYHPMHRYHKQRAHKLYVQHSKNSIETTLQSQLCIHIKQILC